MSGLSRVALGLAGALALLAGPGTGFAADDAAAGAAVFKSRCAECHALDRNKIGPALSGVVGRPAGKAPGYGYSSANLNSKIVWTEAKLEVYLASPKDAVPPRSTHPGGPVTGTKMMFKGLKDAAERKAVIAYLKAN